jgi:hypothetical protein
MPKQEKSAALICVERPDGRIEFIRKPLLPPPTPLTLRQRIANAVWSAVFFAILFAVTILTVWRMITR